MKSNDLTVCLYSYKMITFPSRLQLGSFVVFVVIYNIFVSIQFKHMSKVNEANRSPARKPSENTIKHQKSMIFVLKNEIIKVSIKGSMLKCRIKYQI